MVRRNLVKMAFLVKIILQRENFCFFVYFFSKYSFF